jgi:hypothetical protein
MGDYQQTSTMIDTHPAANLHSHPSQPTLSSYQRQSSSTRDKSQSGSGSSYNRSRTPSQIATAPIPIPGACARNSDVDGEEEDEDTEGEEYSSTLKPPRPQTQGIAGQEVHEHQPQQVQIIPGRDAPHGDYEQEAFDHMQHAAGSTDSPAGPPSPQLRPTHPSNLSLSGSEYGSPMRIKVRDLSHIQAFASEEVLTRSRHGSRRSLRSREGGLQYEISSMPVTDIIEMVAGLLTKITVKNDSLHEHTQRHIPTAENSSALNEQTASVYSFHGKNVPTITILSYLSRIHKYCPTTYEVFLSLLVYFDRMTETINSGTLHSFQGLKSSTEDIPDMLITPQEEADSSPILSNSSRNGPSEPVTPPASGSIRPQRIPFTPGSSSMPSVPTGDASAEQLERYFVVDSFNIHRLVIAGVTCASKFFSDVFYTNSRYAKVQQRPKPCE